MSPFDFLNSINDNKKDLFEDPQAEKDYASFIVNRGLSYFPDTILYANEMNRNHDIPKKWQFDFLRNAIPRKRRFSKWHKKDNVEFDVTLLMKHYKYSQQKAFEILDLLTQEQINNIRSLYEEGGKS